MDGQKIELVFREIDTCGCGDTDEFAKNAYRLLFESDDYPVIKHNSSNVSNDRVREMLLALKKQHQYAYYFEYNSETILQAWDLLKGVRVL